MAPGCTASKVHRPYDPGFPSHRVCRDRGIAHYERLCNIEELVGKGEFHFQGVSLEAAQGLRVAGSGACFPRSTGLAMADLELFYTARELALRRRARLRSVAPYTGAVS